MPIIRTMWTVSLTTLCCVNCLALTASAQDRDDHSLTDQPDAAVQNDSPTSPEGLQGDRPRHPRGARSDDTKRGLLVNTDKASQGYTLYAPLNSTTTYLIDMKGEIVHSWPSKYTPGQAVYLLQDGTLLRCGREPHNQSFGGGGIGGRIERIAPDGTVLWDYLIADETRCQHHDIEPMPNGNVLVIAWEKKTGEEARSAGRDPERLRGDELWPDCILEIQPQGKTGGKIVWEWHVWDHLIQEFNPEADNYDAIAEHPELIDLNYRDMKPRQSRRERRRLRALGYIGGRDDNEDEDEDSTSNHRRRGPGRPGGPGMGADMCHINAVAYNAKLNQIALSVHEYNEIWIIDHSTTKEEAAGHAGGRYGKGGDLLYRWGNPRAYGAAEAKDQQLFAQHDIRWIPDGLPGEGHLLMFNNGGGRPTGRYSSVVEIIPPIDRSGHYTLEPGEAYGPASPCWEYTAPKKESFFSHSISGAERLQNGNTLVCSGEQGRLFEVTRSGKIVWEYLNPHTEHVGMSQAVAGIIRDTLRGPRRGRHQGRPPRGDRDRPEAGDAARGDRADAAGEDNDATPQDQTRERDNTAEGATPPGDSHRAGDSPSRPWGPRRPHPPKRGPGGGWGPPPRGPGGGSGGGPHGGSIFRATRLSPDHPGVQRILRHAKDK